MTARRGIPLSLLLDLLRDANRTEGLGVGTEHLLEHPHTATYRRLIEQTWHAATVGADALREEVTRLRTALPLAEEVGSRPIWCNRCAELVGQEQLAEHNASEAHTSRAPRPLPQRVPGAHLGTPGAPTGRDR